MIYLKYHPNKLMNEYCQYINGLALAGLSISPTLKNMSQNLTDLPQKQLSFAPSCCTLHAVPLHHWEASHRLELNEDGRWPAMETGLSEIVVS